MTSHFPACSYLDIVRALVAVFGDLKQLVWVELPLHVVGALITVFRDLK